MGEGRVRHRRDRRGERRAAALGGARRTPARAAAAPRTRAGRGRSLRDRRADGTSVFFCRTDARDADGWLSDFLTSCTAETSSSRRTGCSGAEPPGTPTGVPYRTFTVIRISWWSEQPSRYLPGTVSLRLNR